MSSTLDDTTTRVEARTGELAQTEQPQGASSTPADADPATTATPSSQTANEPLSDATERMARPWRLSIIGLAIAIGLGTRLLAANKWFVELVSDTMLWVSALASLLAGVGLLAVTQERDRLDRSLTTLSVATGGALAALQWISPHFANGTLRWNNASQVALGALGFGNGILLAGVLALALVRRGPTLTAALLVLAGVSMLAGNTVALRVEWIAVLLWAIAAATVLLAWDRSPRREPHYAPEQSSPRVVRAVLSLTILVLGGTAIQLWISRGETIGRAIPAIGLAVATIAIAFVSMVGLRRQLLNQTTTLSEWSSWMREIRTGELRSGFENLDSPGKPERVLSFPDLRTEDFGLRPEGAPALAGPSAPTFSAPGEFAMAWRDLEADDAATDDNQQLDVTERDEIENADVQGGGPSGAPEGETTRTADVETSRPAMPKIDVPKVEVPKIDVPSIDAPIADTLDDAPTVAPALTLPSTTLPAPPTAMPTPTSDIAEPAPLTWPGQPSTSPAASATPATPAIPSIPATPAISTTPTTPATAATPTPATAEPATAPPDSAPEPASAHKPAADQPRAFGSAIDAEPASDSTAAVSTASTFSKWIHAEEAVETDAPAPNAVAQWLTTSDAQANPTVLAIELMSLAEFDELPMFVSGSMNDAVLAVLSKLAMPPDALSVVDGPYLMAAWNDVEINKLAGLNAEVESHLADRIDTEHGAVGLDAAVALLRLSSPLTFDELINTSIDGLIRARQMRQRAQG